MRCICTSIVAMLLLAGTSFADTHTVLANSTSFSPDAIDVAPGDTIVWQYNSGYPHTVTSGVPCTADGLFYGELQGGGDTFTWEVPLDASGDIPYFCEPHCGMGMYGIITVVAGSQIIHVPGDYPTIQGAIDASSDGDTITIAAGTFNELGLNTQGKSIKIQGTADADSVPLTVIDAESVLGTILTIDSGEGADTIVENISFLNAFGINGAAVACIGSSPVIQNCTFTDGWGAKGGGIYCTASSPTVIDCLFESNRSTFNGGGMCCESNGNPMLANCTFISNTAQTGGGMFCSASNAQVSDCLFEANEATGGSSEDYDAGGLHCKSASSPTVHNCEFTANIGGAAALCHNSSGAQLTACTFSNGPYPGLYLFGGTAAVDGCSFIGNSNGISCGTVNVVVSNCTFESNVNVGIWSTGGLTQEFVNCTIANNGYFGVRCFSTSSASFINCEVRDTSGPGVMVDGWPIQGESHAMLEGCTITGNSTSSSAYGGGVTARDGGSVVLMDCHISQNVAPQGAGVYVGDHPNGGGVTEISMENSLVCGNLTDQIFGDWTDNGGNTIADECPADCAGDLDGNGEVGVDDLLAVLAAFQQNDDGDCDGDGDTDVDDLLLLISAWGSCP